MTILEAINYIEKYLKTGVDLPEDVFFFFSRHTPIINVDLFIKNKKGECLLSWRENCEFFKSGWHVPGGVIRYKENWEKRIKKVATEELNIKNIHYSMFPITVNQFIMPNENRGHFISLLFECSIPKNISFIPNNKIKWFHKCPKNLIDVHKIYKPILWM